MSRDPIMNQRGVGLITAVFLIVVVGMFGVLIARYATISSVASAEDYIWTQALYSAESTLRLNILRRDGGGGLSASVEPKVGGVATEILVDTFTASNQPATIRVQAIHGTKVSRTVEAKFILLP